MSQSCICSQICYTHVTKILAYCFSISIYFVNVNTSGVLTLVHAHVCICVNVYLSILAADAYKYDE